MNIKFLKLRVADDPWLLVDFCGNQPRLTGMADAARVMCHKARGAAARGLVAISANMDRYCVQVWSAAGQPQRPAPTALLCAARWLFDVGRTAGDSMELDTNAGNKEIIILDSRNFGLALGHPSVLASHTGYPILMNVELEGTHHAVRVHDGSIPKRLKLSADTIPIVDHGRMDHTLRDQVVHIDAGCIARHETVVVKRRTDVLVAAASAAAAGVACDFTDRETTVMAGDERIMIQWPERAPLFLAASPGYCLSGDMWLDDNPGDKPQTK
jgi:diaminopimelate epimerase